MGNLGIGTQTPIAQPHVDGSMCGDSYTVATTPNAASVDPGSMIYISDETGGAVMSFSDGTD